MSKRRVLIVFPTAWDARQLERCRGAWEERYELIYAEPTDEDCAWDLDIVDYIERTVETFGGTIHGVISSSDYPGATVAGAVATRLGLPGSPPAAVIRASHKYYSRLAQREAAPDAVPDFALVNPFAPVQTDPPIGFPCFIKPVKGAFSVMSGRLYSREDLEAFLLRPAVHEFMHDYVGIFNQLVRRLTPFDVDGSHFLVETLLHGEQTTIEGYVADDEVEILGIVDSVTHPGGSFARFDYPSQLPAPVQTRMAEIARRAIAHLGLSHTLFNIEMIFDASTNQMHIIEVNPRLCGQFADLYRKVDGVSGYEVALALATGERPRRRQRGGAYAFASSFPLRVFEPVRVLQAPTADDIRSAEALFPGTLVWNECRTGQMLADFERIEDGQSCRYAVVNLGADSRDALDARLAGIRQRLGYDFVRVAPSPDAAPGARA